MGALAVEGEGIEVGLLAVRLLKLILSPDLEGIKYFDDCDGGKLKKARGMAKKLVTEGELQGFYNRLKAANQDEFIP
ncbi:hypothetical protein QUA27_25420 [Microcoleus sp. Pol14C6]|uniref:hypothetical protein n=1 Tax=unclassified Microcoleus TaxID=2642155 RepID=UPI002FD07AFC